MALGELVYNPRGATALDPCPTTVSKWFESGYCSAEDVGAWKRAAANLYELGVLPLFNQLQSVDAEASAGFRPQVTDYQSRYNALPPASILSTSRNLEAVSSVVGLMVAGDALVEGLRAAIVSAGATPMELAVPGPPATPVKKSAWTRYAWPGAIVGSVVLVIGLTAWAAASAGKNQEGGNGRNGNGRKR